MTTLTTARLFTLTLVIFIHNAIAQTKPPIKPTDYEHWLTLNTAATILSYSGKYFAYQITDRDVKMNTTYFGSTEKKWKKAYEGVKYLNISNLADKEIGMALIKDSLWIITLGTDRARLIKDVKNISVSQPNNKEEFSVLKSKWIIIQKNNKSIELINTRDAKSIFIDSVDQYIFLKNTQSPIIKVNKYILRINQSMDIDTIYNLKSETDRLLQALYLVSNKKTLIQVSEESQTKIIEINTPNKVLISDDKISIGFPFNITSSPFSIIDNDSTIIFRVSPKNVAKGNFYDSKGTSLILWSYMDDQLTPDNSDKIPAITIQFAYNIFTQQIKALENDSMAIRGVPSGEWAILTKRISQEDPGGTLLRSKDLNFVQATSVKAVNDINTNIPIDLVKEISPSNKYILYELNNTLSVFSLKNQKTYSLLELNAPIPTNSLETPIVKLAGWSNDNDTVYFYYNNDLYMSSCLNKFETKNLTAGYGARNNVQFYIRSPRYNSIIEPEDLKILLAIDKKNMDHGFYSISTIDNSIPTKLHSGPFYYVDLKPLDPLGVKNLKSVIKARGSNKYLVTRSSVNQSPNLFITNDFKTLKQLTSISPESKYNWIRSELIQFETPSKIQIKGILYKPEDYDSTRKYPLIITSYLEVSPLLNAYLEPGDLCRNCLPNIPTYVSNGYVVFVPDIYRPKGNTFMNAVETIKGALNYLSKIKQIDMDHMGIAGCSFSGFTTDFILTQISSFKAAVVSSGIANPISVFNSFSAQGFASTWYQKGQGNFGVSLYQNPQLYIENATILQANRIQTPLLIMHTTKDLSCPFYDALQFFVALRNLNKKVWLLEYQKGVHAVSGEDIPDFSKRMRNFFDHYLKGAPAPNWMVEKSFDPWNQTKNNLKAKIIE